MFFGENSLVKKDKNCGKCEISAKISSCFLASKNCGIAPIFFARFSTILFSLQMTNFWPENKSAQLCSKPEFSDPAIGWQGIKFCGKFLYLKSLTEPRSITKDLTFCNAEKISS